MTPYEVTLLLFTYRISFVLVYNMSLSIITKHYPICNRNATLLRDYRNLFESIGIYLSTSKYGFQCPYIAIRDDLCIIRAPLFMSLSVKLIYSICDKRPRTCCLYSSVCVHVPWLGQELIYSFEDQCASVVHKMWSESRACAFVFVLNELSMIIKSELPKYVNSCNY